MGRRAAVNVADLPQSRRGLRFTDEEVALLAEEVKKRKSVLYGKGNTPPQPSQVRRAWEEIAAIVSSLCGIRRNGDQCRKRFNDIKRRGQVIVLPRKRGRPPKNPEKPTKTMCSVGLRESKSHLEPVDLEFEVHAPIEDDPDYEPSPKKRAAVKPVVPEVQTHPVPPSPRAAPPPPKPRSSVGGKADEYHPFLELQQAGFNMLERELSGVQNSIMTLQNRMSQIEVLLRPIGHIANSLTRIATAVERLTSPPSP